MPVTDIVAMHNYDTILNIHLMHFMITFNILIHHDTIRYTTLVKSLTSYELTIIQEVQRLVAHNTINLWTGASMNLDIIISFKVYTFRNGHISL